MKQEKLKEISGFFDDPQKALKLLEQIFTGSKVKFKDGTEYDLEEYYSIHKKAYERRLKNKIKHSIKILETEIESTEEPEIGLASSSRTPNLDDYDRRKDNNRNYEAYFGKWDEWG